MAALQNKSLGNDFANTSRVLEIPSYVGKGNLLQNSWNSCENEEIGTLGTK